MSTLEKAMILLQELPEQEIETVYAFIRFIKAGETVKDEEPVSAFGMAHKYANPNLIGKEKEAFANAAIQKHALD